ncbi:Dps family protein [Billgrantia desiderata]|jgi:starvation-inducible DNA-binding protein|uniref:DNA starvation/stationary phase protection protein n=1 Tax=Billgrantia desiderata TaxID=52021 RepID=A0AAW4YXL3_9GAMM|nr:Dps family protein [Halomonas desiderata]MCE8013657.1 DNA starvation/stationary phase protection protein [Halomonas desiderata]MCE8031176.1 DNA starvation/stationary phase protection protein [Halomonas desiderata]MCE8044022.1 DNA starvation/stationary phase protection protein [Halomonas desiderata]MCE8048596.1 DNA starvation/stationary phase protection protein [Halomonas desiderata]MCE8052711.1 DNA starvation/stationary phase protection protein [Halomonas desiderata]
MSDTNAIGLHESSASQLAEKLNALLANYQIFYMNVRGYHWNVKGPQFFELHAKFEEFYTDLLTKVDEVAERILTLGHKPVHAYSDYVAMSQIREDKNVHDGEACVRGVLQGYQTLIELQREVLALASDADDEGTAAQAGDYIREQEKTVWMLNAYLG